MHWLWFLFLGNWDYIFFPTFIHSSLTAKLTVVVFMLTVRSRVLLSHEDEEQEEEFGPHAPFSYKWLLGGIFGGCAASDDHVVPTGQSHQPTLPKVNIMDVETEINQTGGGANVGGGANTDSASARQPDIAVTTSSKPINATS